MIRPDTERRMAQRMNPLASQPGPVADLIEEAAGVGV